MLDMLDMVYITPTWCCTRQGMDPEQWKVGALGWFRKHVRLPVARVQNEWHVTAWNSQLDYEIHKPNRALIFSL